MRRIAVTGTSGSGKTTFALELAGRLGVPCVELDALFWQPGWVEPELEAFRARVREVTAGEGWVLDGNYSRVRDLFLGRAGTVVWLDLPLLTCLWRVARREVRRARTREDLWGSGNHGSWRKLVARDSLLWWTLTTHRRRRRENEAAFAPAARAGVRVLRFRSSSAADTWLARLAPAREDSG